MNDMSKDSISSFSKKDQDVQVIDFCNKLKYTLNHADKDIRDCCVLMPISDIYSSCGRHLSDAIYRIIALCFKASTWQSVSSKRVYENLNWRKQLIFIGV